MKEGRGRMVEDSSSSNSNNKVVFPTVESGYDVLEEIGLGASAVVYRALCKPLNRIVAIKCLDLERINCALVLKRNQGRIKNAFLTSRNELAVMDVPYRKEDIRREAQLMSLIDHQNLIRAYCSFVVDHYLWVVMPYMDGGSCLHIMKVAHPDGFEEQIIATILKDTLKALSYLHQQGHIHRDVKAGNILIDANGGVKLGDFGVSACMFDGGNRKYSRNTFVGTPCWMAPEVMEQKQGYDFRADIWSFGITALELAHGHAPFQKYPPMKVFLMTIQNAPPGLDYERDKRFSKAFREMVSLCLVKDPNKRPTAEKLLKHSFFKQAKSSQFLAHNLLQGVSALWEREKILRENDAARLAQKETPYLEQEETSQNVYKGCMGSWNFDVESLTISNESDDSEPRCDKEDDPRASLIRDNVDSNTSSRCSSSLSLTQLENLSSSSHRGASRSTSEKDDICDSSQFAKNKIIENADSDTKGTQQGASSIVPPLSIMCNQGAERLPLRKKEPMQVGRFDVFDGDLELESPGWQEIVRQRKIIQTEREKKQMGTDQLNESQDSQCQKVVQNVDSDIKFSRYLSCANPESIVANSGWPPANGNGDPLILDPAFSTNHVTSNKEELLGLNSKSLKMQENNLSSFVHNLDNKETSLISKSASTGDCFLLQKNLPIAALVPQLQALIHQTAQQHECLCNMLRSIVPGGSYSSGAGINIKNHMHNASIDDKVVYLMQREHELMCEVSSLKSKEEGLIDQLEILKLKNRQLENQLNSIINQRDADREGL